MEKKCSSCNGKGNSACKECGGTGRKQKITVEKGPCTVCNGTGSIELQCPSCIGSGVLSRALNYIVLETKQIVQQQGILFWSTWHQIVTVVIQNAEAYSGSFLCSVSLKQQSYLPTAGQMQYTPQSLQPQSQSKSLVIPPYATGSFIFDFQINNGIGFPSEFNVLAPQISLPCTACNGLGKQKNICNGCGGNGQIDVSREIEEICTKCSGTCSIKCTVCNGTGAVPRFEQLNPKTLINMNLWLKIIVSFIAIIIVVVGLTYTIFPQVLVALVSTQKSILTNIPEFAISNPSGYASFLQSILLYVGILGTIVILSLIEISTTLSSFLVRRINDARKIEKKKDQLIYFLPTLFVGLFVMLIILIPLFEMIISSIDALNAMVTGSTNLAIAAVNAAMGGTVIILSVFTLYTFIGKATIRIFTEYQ